MYGKSLIEQLTVYTPFDIQERAKHHQMLSFLSRNENGFHNKNLPGHVTGSAWILDSSRKKVLMTHHIKLEKWLQLGGHADGSGDILSVALREAEEESGLHSVKPLSFYIFDVDVHAIPERKNFPNHFHYDVRFLFDADETEPFRVSDESFNLQWINIEDVRRFNDEDSILRLVEKSETMNLLRFLESGYW
ncbi:MAG: NUDIX hydrolase [Candidatus Cloacimonetes bacterium]|nr:NUDIX hydrolase [Candidatus Cloacimonadota bacterium]